MSNTLYVPILKWKKGEQEALKNLSLEHKSKIMPLIEIIDYEELETILNSLENCYPNPLFIDTIIAAEDDRDFLLSIVEESKKIKKRVYPIFYFDDFQDTINSFIPIIEHAGIRIPVPEDIEGPTYSELFETIKKFKGKNNIVLDIILDLNVITERNNANRQLRETKDIINHFLVNESFYNSIIISSTSFPKDISFIAAGGQESLPRFDIKLFFKLLSDGVPNAIKDKLIYSDYGVTKFTDTEIDFSRLRFGILPKIKYTTYDKYIILKGARNHETRKITKGYIDLAKEIVKSDYYFGEDFSFGDLEIKERALNKKGTGNHGNWVTISANHHIAVVIEQLSKNSEI